MDSHNAPLWHTILRKLSLLLAIELILVTLLCYIFGTYFSKLFNFYLPPIAGLWCAISGIIVTHVTVQESMRAAWLRIIGSFIGAICGFVVIMPSDYGLISLAGSLLLTTMICSLFHVKNTVRLACLTVLIIVVVGMMKPSIPAYINAFSRFVESAIGAIIAILVSYSLISLRKKLNLLRE